VAMAVGYGFRNFDFLSITRSIFDEPSMEPGREVALNYSCELTGVHDRVTAYYTEDGYFEVKERGENLIAYLPLEELKEEGRHILTHDVTAYFIGKKEIISKDYEGVINGVLRLVKKNFKKEVEALEVLTPGLLLELAECNHESNVLSSAYLYIISYIAMRILEQDRYNEGWNIEKIAKELKKIENPINDFPVFDVKELHFLKPQLKEHSEREYTRGLGSLRLLYAISKEPKEKKLVTSVALNALFKLYTNYGRQKENKRNKLAI